MGFGLGNIGKIGKKIFGGGKDALWGAGNLLTFGALAQKEAAKDAKKARDQATQQYADAQKAAEAEAARIAGVEEERKRRLALFGTKNPPTLINSYLGVTEGSGTLG